MNYLFLGDRLNILRDKNNVADDSIDLIYIDPPFNSKRDYNLLIDDKEILLENTKGRLIAADFARKEPKRYE